MQLFLLTYHLTKERAVLTSAFWEEREKFLQVVMLDLPEIILNINSRYIRSCGVIYCVCVCMILYHSGTAGSNSRQQRPGPGRDQVHS